VYKEYAVEKKSSGKNSDGRQTRDYKSTGTTLLGALSNADPREQEKYKQMQHPITHTIAQRGTAKAKAEDRLVRDGRKYYVQGVNDPGDLGLWTVYYVEEREA